MHNSMLFLSLMLDNLSLSSVLNSPSGHRINRRSVWKKTIFKTEKIRVLPLTCMRVREPTYAGLTTHMHVAGQRSPSHPP